MENYILSWHDSAKNTGGVKAKDDTDKFLKKLDYKVIDTPYGKISKVLYIFFILPLVLIKIKPGIVFVQFPSGTPVIMKKIITSIKKYTNAKLIMLVHDVEALRLHSGSGHEQETKAELERLNSADGLIVLNTKMKKWLTNKGITIPMVDLQVWDYDNLQPFQENPKFDNSICFAGNLGKSVFLKNLNLRHNLSIFGSNQLESYPENTKYEGAFSPDELPKHICQNWGLVWDGPKIDTCDGAYGSYLRYNNPHKVSLYLSTGIPVIIWKDAAIADFISKNNLGILVSDLSELDNILDKITEAEYAEFKKNAVSIGLKMRNGFFLNTALNNLLKTI